MNNFTKYGKVVLVVLLFIFAIVLVTWNGAPHYRVFLALICAALGGIYAHKFGVGKV